jgi:hypothetical protein
MSVLKIDAGKQTEPLLKEVLNSLDDATLDTVGVDRTFAPADGLGSEPITIAVTLTLSPAVAIGLTIAVRKWLENRRQEEQVKLLIDAYALSDEAGKSVERLTTLHAGVAVKLHDALPQNPAKPG